ncbi:hypothetical protein K493DRAFT_313327 [Basidiobolus meristosporus CBS 931.73]|uniref:Folliculin n=1 Tax=Basidiobolus meristosporus CBS 931.73 TaxID=1314790 RepID=A0A1Y1YMD7_9FUNG|nr:hypothetical protein K493DRAFT_313327 [Basidiobolus meristosporus CBS 931.73]|eukprot:ORX99177.1 hypothetical protein K493DRAFT_313327 [Basidiobolus meristosporus CBS 931.73]
MNALVSLVHFCEVHGPSVVFCTQPYHASHSMFLSDAVSPDSPYPQHNLSLSTSYSFSYSHAINPSLNKPQNPVNPTASTPPTVRRNTEPNTFTFPSQSSQCPSCTANLPPLEIPGDLDPASDASLATRSTEAKGFLTRDLETPDVTYIGSRSPLHPRLYSALRQACVRSLSCEFCPGREGPVLFGDDKNGYVLSYMFKLKDRQARGSQRWYSFIFLMSDRLYLVTSWPFLVKKFKALASELQEKAEKVYDKEKASLLDSPQDLMRNRSSFGPVAPDQFLRRRGSQSLRSLDELLGVKNLFVNLHANFSWILKACSRRLQEKQVEGQPMIGSSDDSGLFNNSFIDAISNTMKSQKISIQEEHPRASIKNLLELEKLLEHKAFRKLVFNCVIGNQVIVRGDEEPLVKSIISVLQEIIPLGCSSVMSYEASYQEIWKCNLLGLQKDAEFPEDVDKSSSVLLDLGDGKDWRLDFGSDELSKDSEEDSRETPSFMDQLEAVLKLPLSPQIIHMQIIILKENWLRKTKQFIQFVRAGGGENPNAIKDFLNVLGIKDHDLLILRFWARALRFRS